MNCARKQPDIVPYEAVWLEEVAQLQVRMWSPDPLVNQRYFLWKYARNPWFPREHVWLARDGARIVGMRGFYGSAWECGGAAQPVLLPVADDAAVAPDRERQGVMQSLMRSALGALASEGFSFVINLSAGPVTLLEALATGWRATAPLGALSRSGRQAGRGVALRDRLRRLPALWRLAGSRMLEAAEERRPFAALDRSWSQQLRSRYPRLSVAAEARPQAMADLVVRLGHDGRLRHVRNREWFEWRLANPLCAYRYIYWDDTQLEGYAVLERRISPYSDRLCTAIVDCEAVTQEVTHDLLRCASSLDVGTELLLWSGAMPRATLPLLPELGFEPRQDPAPLAQQRPCILIKSLGPTPGSPEWRLSGLPLCNLGSWDMRRIYAM